MARLRTACLSLMIAAASVALAPSHTPMTPAPAHAQQEGEALDRVTLRNGRVVEGRVLEVTDSEVTMLVIVAGIEAETTYPRTEVLEIERNVVAVEGEAPDAKSTSPGDRKSPRQRSGGPVLYRLPLEGHLMGAPFAGVPYLFQVSRRDVLSYTPIEKALEDAKSHDPDVIIVEVSADSPGGFDGLFVTEGIAPLFEQAQREGHRIVFWVENAGGGAAFLPMLSREMYFKPDGELGGVGNLGDFDMGDTTVNEKQISLRLGHAEGIAIQNGYDPVLVRAMAREENWLAFRLEGGKPVYIEHEPRPQDGPGWTVLTDDGQGDNADTSPLEGNDVLNLGADIALTLGVSEGTASTVDDLAFMLGFRDDYDIVTGKGRDIISDWQTRLARSVDQLQRLLDQANQRGGRNNRAALGRQLRTLEEARSILTTYAEVLDPTGATRSRIDVQIEAVRQQIRGASDRGGGRSGPGRIGR